MTKVLRLPVKKEYFEQILSGTKTEEYREVKEYWGKRIVKEYDEVWITLGYPASDEEDKILKFKWSGYEIKEITHKEFGNIPTKVYAIQLEERVYDTEEMKSFLDSLITFGEKAFEDSKNRDKDLLKTLQVLIFYRGLIDFSEKEKEKK